VQVVRVLVSPTEVEAMEKMRGVTRGVKTEYPASGEIAFLTIMCRGYLSGS
jgi:hypothetical protein